MRNLVSRKKYIYEEEKEELCVFIHDLDVSQCMKLTNILTLLSTNYEKSNIYEIYKIILIVFF